MRSGDVLFRCDAGPLKGTGHVYRCMSLADTLAWLGWRCRFAVAPGSLEVVPGLARWDPLRLPDDSEADAAAEVAALSALSADLLVVDHYERDAAFERSCRGAFRRILILDDAPTRSHDCDLLLDCTPGRVAADYAGLVPPDAQLLCGPTFAPLRPEFGRARSAALARRGGSVRRVLIAVGGSDASGATALAVSAVRAALPSVAIDVIAGSAAPDLPLIREAVAAAGKGCVLHVDPPTMATLMTEADLAIGAPGSTSWERCTLGLPTLLFTIAENQRSNAAALARARAADDLGPPDGWTFERLAARILSLCHAPERLRRMAQAAAALTDGKGALRVALALAGQVEARNGVVTLRAAEASDADLILGWQAEPGARRHARNPAVPTAAEHEAWMAARLNGTDRITAVVERDGVPAGLLRLDPMNSDSPNNRFEVSILIASAHRSAGVGAAALTLARRLAPGRDLWAEVLPDNEASRRLFERAGYRPVDGTWLVSEAGRAQ